MRGDCERYMNERLTVPGNRLEADFPRPEAYYARPPAQVPVVPRLDLNQDWGRDMALRTARA